MVSRLVQQQVEDLYRKRISIESPQGAEVVVNGRRVISFCSNDYLGLANHPLVLEAFTDGAKKWGVGSGASQLVCGFSNAHRDLEIKIAQFLNRSRALVFSSGYLANLGVLTTLANRHTRVFGDKLNHASMIDACKLAGVHLKRYRHLNMAHLTHLLSALNQTEETATLLQTDGLFSMDGDIAPLHELTEIAGKVSATVIVDDAHGIGVMGHSGRGCLEMSDLGEEEVPVLVGTFGKAFGTFGAFVSGNDELIESLIQFSRPLIYTTALPPAIGCATQASLKLIGENSEYRLSLHERIAQFQTGARELDLPVLKSGSPIQPLIVGENKRAVMLSQQLLDRGFWVTAIRPPTVPKGTARLRITLSAAHSESQINQLLDALSELWK